MMIRLYRQETTIPKIRAAIQASKQVASIFDKHYGISKFIFDKG